MHNKLLLALALAIAFCFILVIVGFSAPKSADAPDRPPVSSGADPTAATRDEGATPAGAEAVVEASNSFGFDLLAQLAAEKPNANLFFSPYSIATALGMTAEGAAGQTLSEMRTVLALPSDDSIRLPAVGALYNRLNASERPITLRTANALWPDRAFALDERFAGTVAAYYGGLVQPVDFRGDPEAARQTINDWVAEETNDRIQDLLSKGSVGASTPLVLTNAIYFKGTWHLQFDETNTTQDTFSIDETTTVVVPLMQLTGEDAEFPYAETEAAQVLELPYEGEDLAMLAILPRTGSLADLTRSLTATTVTTWRDELREQRVDVFLPRFTLETKYSLPQELSALGMPTAFSPAADFSGMTGDPNELMIDDVIHQAFVEVNEEGTEAAAATAVSMRETSIAAAPPVFRADRPFLFLIHDRESDAILFLGVVRDPSGGA